MNFILNNVAKVAFANVKLEGVTVLVGENGSGKSTICNALYSLLELSRWMPSLIKLERVRSIVNDILVPYLEVKGLRLELYDILFFVEDCVDELNRLTQREFWSSFGGLVAYLKEADDPRTYRKPIQLHSGNIDDLLGVEDFNEVSRRIQEVLDRPDADYARYVIEQWFSLAYSGSLAHVDERQVEMSAQLVSAEEGQKIDIRVPLNSQSKMEPLGLGSVAYSSKLYLKPVHFLDDNARRRPLMMIREDVYRYLLRQRLDTIIRDQIKCKSMEEKIQHDRVLASLAEIIQTIHGKIERIERAHKFVERIGEGEYPIPLGCIASGSKTMALLTRALENRIVRFGGLLIVDEPESNLHPAWQLKLAHYLVRISAEFKIKVVVSTHSPYFMRAIQKYADEVGTRESCHFYLMEAERSAVAAEGTPDVNQEIDDSEVLDLPPSTYHTQEVTDRMEEVFATLCAPLEEVL